MNILLVTGHFPSFDCPGKSYATQFLYNYAYEWAQMGHNVHVIHLCRRYPIVFNLIANLLGKFGYTKLQRYVVSPEAQVSKDYEHKNVVIHRRSYLKLKPHGKLGVIGINRLSKKTRKIIKGCMNNPDFVVGDCLDPVLKVLYKNNDIITSKRFQVIHDSDFKLLSDPVMICLLRKTDRLLLRSKKQLTKIKLIIGEHPYKYMFSGIPDTVLCDSMKPRNRIRNLIFVGALYKSKGLETVLRAVSKSDSPLNIKVVGDGVDRKYFEDLTKKLNICQRVNFIGKVPHEEVFDYMRNADALVLISQETFGMVYVEAMSQGCIPIGAKNEGIDGVVEDCNNGFLVQLGDVDQLSDLFNSFQSLPMDEVKRLSENAFFTASKMTDRELAQSFLNDVI